MRKKKVTTKKYVMSRTKACDFINKFIVRLNINTYTTAPTDVETELRNIRNELDDLTFDMTKEKF